MDASVSIVEYTGPGRSKRKQHYLNGFVKKNCNNDVFINVIHNEIHMFYSQKCMYDIRQVHKHVSVST